MPSPRDGQETEGTEELRESALPARGRPAGARGDDVGGGEAAPRPLAAARAPPRPTPSPVPLDTRTPSVYSSAWSLDAEADAAALAARDAALRSLGTPSPAPRADAGGGLGGVGQPDAAAGHSSASSSHSGSSSSARSSRDSSGGGAHDGAAADGTAQDGSGESPPRLRSAGAPRVFASPGSGGSRPPSSGAPREAQGLRALVAEGGGVCGGAGVHQRGASSISFGSLGSEACGGAATDAPAASCAGGESDGGNAVTHSAQVGATAASSDSSGEDDGAAGSLGEGVGALELDDSWEDAAQPGSGAASTGTASAAADKVANMASEPASLAAAVRPAAAAQAAAETAAAQPAAPVGAGHATPDGAVPRAVPGAATGSAAASGSRGRWKTEGATVAAGVSPRAQLDLTRLSSASPETDEDGAWAAWARRRRHFFVVTSAGKPLYTRHGDESALAGFLAVIQAIVSVVADLGDGVRALSSGPLRIVLLQRGHLYLAAASTRGEPDAALRQQLHLLHQHLLLLVTGGIERALQRHPGYDARGLLSGSQGTLDALLASMGDDPFWMAGVLEPAPLGPAERRAAAGALAMAVQGGGAMYGLISAGRQVVALHSGTTGPQLSTTDAQLLVNFLASNDALRVGESFVPVCLPGYNASAFVHAYVGCLDEAGGVFVALLTGAADAFHRLAAKRVLLEEALHQAGVLRRLAEARGARGAGRVPLEAVPPAAGGGVPGAAALWHFAAVFPGRRQGVQAAHAAHVFPDRHATKEVTRAFVRAYCTLHAQRLGAGATSGTGAGGGGGGSGGGASLGSASGSGRTGTGGGAAVAAVAAPPPFAPPQRGAGPRPGRLLWIASPRWALLATADRELELYCCFDPLTHQEAAVRAGDSLRRWLVERVRTDALLLPHGTAPPP